LHGTPFLPVVNRAGLFCVEGLEREYGCSDETNHRKHGKEAEGTREGYSHREDMNTKTRASPKARPNKHFMYF
jgi:hypothetical protein